MVTWDQAFRLCQEKLRNTDSYSLFPFLSMASAEMEPQKDRYKKIMKESLIIPYTFQTFANFNYLRIYKIVYV